MVRLSVCKNFHSLLFYSRTQYNSIVKNNHHSQLAVRWPHFIRYDNPTLARGSCSSPLSLRAVQKARRGNLLANRSPHYVRDDNPNLVIAKLEKLKQSPYNQHLFWDYFATLVMTKKQDGHVVLKDSSP